MLTEILLIAILLLIYLYWSTSMQAREIALNATLRQCKKLDLQLLDQCVALRGFWFKRNHQGKMCAWRSYTFEFSSTGEERYHGLIILLGHQIQSIQMQPYRIKENHDD